MWKAVGGLASGVAAAQEAAVQAQKVARAAMNDLDSHMMSHIDEEGGAGAEAAGAAAAAGDDSVERASDGWPANEPMQGEQEQTAASDGWDDDGWAPAPSPPPAAHSSEEKKIRASAEQSPTPRSAKLGAVKKPSAKPKTKARLKPKAKPADEPDVSSETAPDAPPPDSELPDSVRSLNDELAQEVARAKEDLAETRQRLERQLAESEASKLALKESITAKAKAKVKEVREECATKCSALEAQCADLQKQLAAAQRSCDERSALEEKLAAHAEREAHFRKELDSKAAEIGELRSASEQAADAAEKAAEGWASEVQRLEGIIAARAETEPAAVIESTGGAEAVATLRAEVKELHAQLAAAQTASMSVQQLRSELSKRGLSPKGTKQELQARLADSYRVQQPAQEGGLLLGREALKALERQTVRETGNDHTSGDTNEALEAPTDTGTVLSEANWSRRETELTSAHVAALETAVQQAAKEARQTAMDAAAEAQRRIEDLEADLSRATAAVAAGSTVSTVSAELQAECDQLQATLAETQTALTAREEELGNAAERAAQAMEEMMTDAQHMQTELSSSKNETATLRERVKSLEAAMESHGNEMGVEQQKLADQAKSVELTLSTELKQVRSALSAAEENLSIELAKGKQRAKWKEEFERQLDATEAAVVERDNTIATLKAEVKDLRKGDKQGSKLVEELKATLEKEKKDRLRIVKQKQEKIDFLNAELNATRDSVGEKHSVADDAIRQAEEASARVQALEEAQKSLAEQLKARDSEVESTAMELEQTEKKVLALEEAKEEVSLAAEKAQDAEAHAIKEAEAARQDVAALQSALAAQKDSAEASEAALRSRAEQMVGTARQGTRELEREVEDLRQKLDDATKDAERAIEERDNNNAEFIKYKTRSHVMLKKKEEELRRAMATAPQAEGALQEALLQVEELTQRNEDLQQQLKAAENSSNASRSATGVVATFASSGNTVVTGDESTGIVTTDDRVAADEVARLSRVIEELRTGAAEREKSLTQDMQALLEDSEAAETRHTEALEVEQAARLTLEKALDRQSEATEQLDQRLQREMEASLAHKTRADALARELAGGGSGANGGGGGNNSGGNCDVNSAAAEAAEDAAALRRMEQMQGIVLHQQLQNEGAAEGARPTGSAALKPVDLDYIRNVVVKLLETEEIETYLPILSKLLSFSDADEEVVRDSFGEKETYTFRLW